MTCSKFLFGNQAHGFQVENINHNERKPGKPWLFY
jgi:hypothetical protein